MQAQQEKGEQMFEIRGKTITRTIVDISQSGIKLQSNDEGQVSGQYDGVHMETVTIWIKTDNANEWENKAIELTKDGDFVAVWGKGTGKNTSPTKVEWSGEVSYMTQSPKLSWLNSTKGWVEGWADNVTGELHGKVYAMK